MIPDRQSLQVSVRSDAATETLGWSGELQLDGQGIFRTRGNFTESERSLHINALTLLRCWYTILSLLPLVVPQDDWPRTHVSCELDNTTAIKYARVAVRQFTNVMHWCTIL